MRTVFLNTQMRVGSTWLGEILCDMLGVNNWTFWSRGGSIRKRKFAKCDNKLVKLHWAEPELICRAIEGHNKYHISMTRNLYDVIVSSLFYMRYDKPLRKLEHLEDINNVRIEYALANKDLSDKEFINKFVHTRRCTLKNKYVEPWLMYNSEFAHPQHYMTQYAAMKANTFKVARLIRNFLNLELPNKRLKQIIKARSFKSRTGRKPGDEDSQAFRRKGIVGDYKNYLDSESIEIIDALTLGRANEYREA